MDGSVIKLIQSRNPSVVIEGIHQPSKNVSSLTVFWSNADNEDHFNRRYPEIATVQLLGREASRDDISKLVSEWMEVKEDGKWSLRSSWTTQIM